MNRFLACALSASLVLLCSAVTSSAQNVLVNPGFETGTAPGNADVGGAPGWSAFGNVFNVSSPNPNPVGPHSGTGALKEFGTFPGVSGAFQSFPTTAGTAWSLSGFGLNASSDAMQPDNFGTLKISFQDAGNNEILGIDSNHITNATPQNVWTLMTANGVAPAGTNHVNLFALFVQPNFNGGSAFFDDLSGGAVPEPATLALSAIVMLGGCIRRRR
jgi:opacity protein-like surface antigen